MTKIHCFVTTSWDDGHKLDKKLVKLLKKYGIKGTFYISPKNQEFTQKELLSEKEVKDLSKNFEIGAHTITHPLLPNDLPTLFYKLLVKLLTAIEGKEYKIPKSISTLDAEKEIKESKKYLEKLLGKEILSFCYPAGRHNSKIVNIVKESGFKYARTVDEYNFSLPKNFLLSETSLHTYRHLRDIYKRAKFSNWSLKEFKKNSDWKYLAKRMFDNVHENGGVFHLWGHSWMVEEEKEWAKLEHVLSYISHHKDVMYINNSELLNI